MSEGSITGISVVAANTNNFDLIADVGDYSTDGDMGTWTGSAAAVTLTHVGSKNAQVAKLVVTTNGRDNLTGLYALTTAFGGGTVDPAAEAFGFERAEEVGAEAVAADRAEKAGGIAEL